MRFDIRPRIRRGFRLALRRPDLTEAEVDEELRFHIASRIDQLVSRGLTREQAAAEARRRFGLSWDNAMARVHEAGRAREERLAMTERLDAWWQDIRYATRTLSRQRGFALVVIATFALGIGANATMFGVIDRLLLRPPPGVGDAESLGIVSVVIPNSSLGRNSNLHYPLVAALLADSSVFTGAAAATDADRFTLGRGANAEEIFASFVSDSYFPLLRARPALGRLLDHDDIHDVSPAPVVLSYGFWQRRFGGQRSAIGKTLQIGPRYFTVVGVAERGFTGFDPRRVDAWMPVAVAGALRGRTPNWDTTWGSYWINVLARAKPGLSPALVDAHVTSAYVNGRAAWLASAGRSRATEPPRLSLMSVMPSRQLQNNAEARIARLLGLVAGVVLLIGCANIANLLLARGTERRREIAVRLTLGVTRRRLIRLLLAETTLLAAIGGAVALVVAVVGMKLLRGTLLTNFEWIGGAVDPRLLGVTLALVAITAAVAGLAPALSATRPNVTESLKSGGREGGVRRSRTSTTLIVVQAALSVMLLVGAGLFVTSLRRIASLRLGYDVDRALSVSTDLATLGYEPKERYALFTGMRQRIAALPGVTSVAMSATHPLHGWAFGMWVTIPGRDSLPQAKNGGPYYNLVSGDYFSTLGLRILEGRAITDADVASNARVVVFSEPMARAYWPGESAVGRCVWMDGDSTCTTVIGVADNARERLKNDEERFLSYVPATPTRETPSTVLLVRTRTDKPERLTADIRRAIQSVSPNLPFVDVQSLPSMLSQQVRPWQLGATLFSLFGGLAAVIAALGLYSAISYRVSQRRHEFGVRLALGAQVRDIIGLVVGHGVRATIVGVLVGCAAAFVAGRYVVDLLFDTSPRDPVVFAVVAVLAVTVAAAATLIPAWRSSRVDPASALRAD
ncbi:MAG TPA: ADOP family duplicated permease [Gemmatimonadaceae bacterium]|nr:ADOP family duplicated permease [Gemmatimonadaceae bacterium]